MNLRAETTVDAEELLVHESGQGQTVECFHAGVVHSLCVLDLTLLLESEVFCEMSALMVASQ